jgi:nitrate/nitrite transport system ATP-binding protein
MAFLEIEAVSKSYGTGASRHQVLSDVTLEVEEGEFVAIVGFSGSGKSTLVSLIAGLIEPTSGTIRLRDQVLRGPGPDRGVVFQHYSLLPWMTARENVALAVDKVFGRWPRRRRSRHVERYLELVNLAAAAEKRPHELSGGMRQRVALARSLAMEPAVLLLDEPLSALDALTRASLGEEIERIWSRRRRTVLLITNDVDEAILLADRILPLHPGPGATLGSAFEVHLPRPRRRTVLNRDPEFRRLRGEVLEYLLESRGRRAAGAGARANSPPALAGLPGGGSRN